MAKKNKPRLAIFINHPECSIHCASGMYEAMSADFNIEIFNNTQFNKSIFKKADIIAFPGGIGDSDTFDRLVGDKKNYIADALDKGVRYLGICMGAYWADKYYFDILDDIRCVQYIKQPTADVKRSFGTTANVKWLGNQTDMYFYDGCTFTSENNNFETYASYANGEPMAIRQKNIGLIGCHPESMPSWYTTPSMKLRWHNYEHHKLLCDFTKDLLEK
jgi:hypothetical protein